MLKRLLYCRCYLFRYACLSIFLDLRTWRSDHSRSEYQSTVRVCTCVCARVEMEGKAWYVVSARSLLVLCSFSATVLLVLCDRHGMYYIGRAEVSFPVRVSARCCGAAYCVCALVRARVTTSSTFTCISQYVLETW